VIPDSTDRSVSTADAPQRAAPRLGPVVAWPVLIGAAWAVLAMRSPTVTYHLAPFLVAAAGPVATRVSAGTRLASRAAAWSTTVSLGVALVVTGWLAVAGALAGPALWGGSGAIETPIFAVVGGTWGWRAATRSQPGLLGLLG
jgi:hypothetical protein